MDVDVSLWRQRCLHPKEQETNSHFTKCNHVEISICLNIAPNNSPSVCLSHCITTDNKLRWGLHTDNVCKTVSRRVFLLSKLRYIVDIDTRKVSLNARIKPHIDYASVVWDRCRDVLKKETKSSAQTSYKINLSRCNSNYWSEIKQDQDKEPAQTTGIQPRSVRVQGP